MISEKKCNPDYNLIWNNGTLSKTRNNDDDGDNNNNNNDDDISSSIKNNSNNNDNDYNGDDDDDINNNNTYSNNSCKRRWTILFCDRCSLFQATLAPFRMIRRLPLLGTPESDPTNSCKLVKLFTSGFIPQHCPTFVLNNFLQVLFKSQPTIKRRPE